MGHDIKDCNGTSDEAKELPEVNLPILLALKVKSKLIEKKSMPQRNYLGRSDEGMEGNSNFNNDQVRKSMPMKGTSRIFDIETNLNSNWLRPDDKEKNNNKAWSEGNEERNLEVSLF
ncbi:hypothetical protein GOBAR_DD27337 [Gossypium barbadense]|nr:hypothetical protein GOBAR_DD27337 [Gossypium barbadense]